MGLFIVLVSLIATASFAEISEGDRVAIPGSFPGVLVQGEVTEILPGKEPHARIRWNRQEYHSTYHSYSHLLMASHSISVTYSDLPTQNLLRWPMLTPVSLEEQWFVLGDHAPNEFGAQPFPIVVLGSFMRIRCLDLNYFETRHRTVPTENMVFALLSDVLSEKESVPLYAISRASLGIAESFKVRESLLVRQSEPNQSPLPLNVTLAEYRAGLLHLGSDSAVSHEPERATRRVTAVKREFERTLRLPLWKRTLRDCTRLILEHSASYLERGLIDFTRRTEGERSSLPNG